MNEITRIHIAKTAYDIEIAAKKQLEKYIKSLEAYTQDADVFTDIEIRITELLAERNVAAGGVINSEDVSAVRAQLGEPYEFSDGEGDIAVGTPSENTGRRLYRSTDDAVLGGVLSGAAAYFNVNPLWVRLAFIIVLFISFGFASLLYALLWIFIPPARTATEKLQLAGKDVTLESIKELNIAEEAAQPNRLAPTLQNIFTISLGTISLISALTVLSGIVWMLVGALTLNAEFMEMMNGFTGIGDDNAWIVWMLFWIVVFGLSLLAALFGLVAYAFFAKKLTKTMMVSGVVIIALGITSVAATIGISATQSFRVANETRSMMRETKTNLPKDFASVKSAVFTVRDEESDGSEDYFGNYVSMRYVVDEGPARYEFESLPTARVKVTIEGTEATIDVTIPDSYRNSFVQPMLTVYGPALETVTANASEVNYAGEVQDALTIISDRAYNTGASGSFGKVVVKGSGSVDLGSSSILVLEVQSEQDLSVTAGTVRELTVTQPDVCPSSTYNKNTNVTISGVTSGQISYNGTMLPVASHETSCAAIILEEATQY